MSTPDDMPPLSFKNKVEIVTIGAIICGPALVMLGVSWYHHLMNGDKNQCKGISK